MYHVSGVTTLGAKSEFACGKAALHFLGTAQALTDFVGFAGQMSALSFTPVTAPTKRSLS